MICLRTFDTKDELLDVLEAAGLARTAHPTVWKNGAGDVRRTEPREQMYEAAPPDFDEEKDEWPTEEGWSVSFTESEGARGFWFTRPDPAYKAEEITERFHDQSCVDVFEVRPRINGAYTIEGPDGEQQLNGWHDDMDAEPGWTANIARPLTVDEEKALAGHIADGPAHPRRVFA